MTRITKKIQAILDRKDIENVDEQEKFVSGAIKSRGSLRSALGLKSADEKIRDVSDEKIKELVEKGKKFESKLVLYADLMGIQGDKLEKKRILNIIKSIESN